MPHKFNAARRHKFDKAQYRVINWAEYNESLRQRGDLTIWVSDEAQSVCARAAPHVTGWPAEILGSGDRDMPDAAHGVSAWVATNAGADGFHWHAHGAGYTGAGLLHTVASRKRLEHRAGDEASRVLCLSIWWWTVPASRSSAKGNGSRRSIKPGEYAAAGANSTSDRTSIAVRLFAPI